MNSERYVGDSKLHEMVEIAMEESWEVCVAHMQRLTETIAQVIAEGAASGEFDAPDVAAGGDVHLHRDDAVLPSADDRASREQAGAVAGPDGRFCAGRTDLARQGETLKSQGPSCHSGAMRSIEPGISRSWIWSWRTIPE